MGALGGWDRFMTRTRFGLSGVGNRLSFHSHHLLCLRSLPDCLSRLVPIQPEVLVVALPGLERKPFASLEVFQGDGAPRSDLRFRPLLAVLFPLMGKKKRTTY